MNKTKLKIWLQAMRPFSFSASVMPVLVGGAVVFMKGYTARWGFFTLIILCAVMVHAGVNAVSDFFDFRRGVDKPHTLGSSRVLVEGLATPNSILILGLSLFFGAFVLGIPVMIAAGKPLILIVIFGFLGGFFYTALPLGYKYIGLGDFFVFLLMGPLMVIGAALALGAPYEADTLYISLPIGFLVTEILSSNNLRDILHDREAGVVTLENRIGFKGSQWLNISWIVSAYLGVIIMVISGVLPAWSLIVFLTFPMAKKNMGIILTSREEDPKGLSMIDVMSAKLHMSFGLLLVISLIIRRFV